MEGFIYRVVVYIGCFLASFWALLGLDFERFIRKGKTQQAQLLVLLMAMALGYLVAQFIMALMYKNIFM